LSGYVAEFDYPVYQGTWVDGASTVADLDTDALDDVFQIVEGRDGRTDSDCVDVVGRTSGPNESVYIDFDFMTDYQVTTVQYNIPTAGVTVTGKATSDADNSYDCAYTTE